MTPSQKIQYVKDAINEKTQISPKGSVSLRLLTLTEYEDGPTLLSNTEQQSIIKKLEEDGFVKNVVMGNDGYSVSLEAVSKHKSEQTKQVIRDRTLECISHHLATLGSGARIVNLFEEWGVPDELIEDPNTNTKWLMVFSVLKHYAVSPDKKDREKLFEIIGEILHPLMYNGDKQTAEIAAESFNKYLEYDNLAVLYSDADKKYSVCKAQNLTEVDEEELLFDMNQDLFEREQEELQFLRLQENRDRISTLRKAYQIFMNIVEVYCESPSKPTQELNDAYVKTKKLITDAVGILQLSVRVNRIHTLTHYCIPFNNLFTAEAEYKRTSEKLHWDEIRPKMHATYGCIDEVYREVDGSDVLSKPDVQKTLNDVSLLLSKTREKNKETTKKTEKTNEPAITKIEITSMPELKFQGHIPAKKKVGPEIAEYYLNSSGDLWREPKDKYCYSMMEAKERLALVKFLAEHQGERYIKTQIIASALSKDVQYVRSEAGKINIAAQRNLKLKLIDSKQGSGYRINPALKIKILTR